MNWEAIGAVGEIVGAVAVVLTLIYLTVQLRHSSQVIEMNSAVIRADAWAETFQMELEFDRLLVSDSDIMDLWMRGGAQRDLAGIDFQRWRRLVRARVNLARAGFQRAKVAGTAQGRFVDLLAREIVGLSEFKRYWQSTIGTNATYLPDRDFVSAVNDAIEQYEHGERVDPLAAYTQGPQSV